jgi:hypothetical protein
MGIATWREGTPALVISAYHSIAARVAHRLVLLQVALGTFHVDLLSSCNLSADPIKSCGPSFDVFDVRRFKRPIEIRAL